MEQDGGIRTSRKKSKEEKTKSKKWLETRRKKLGKELNLIFTNYSVPKDDLNNIQTRTPDLLQICRKRNTQKFELNEECSGKIIREELNYGDEGPEPIRLWE